MTRTLYVATGSTGKLRDFATAAHTVGGEWQIEPLPGLSAIAAPPEDGTTFLENAQAKALYYAAFAPPESTVIADDSGLVVDALGGAPGVYSARYASLEDGIDPEENKDERNNARLLRELAHSGAASPWHAHYQCVLAVVHGGVVESAEGSVAGEIIREPRGTNGFGYDPYFLLPHFGLTMAELDTETRLRFNHRGAALRRLLGSFI